MLQNVLWNTEQLPHRLFCAFHFCVSSQKAVRTPPENTETHVLSCTHWAQSHKRGGEGHKCPRRRSLPAPQHWAGTGPLAGRGWGGEPWAGAGGKGACGDRRADAETYAHVCTYVCAYVCVYICMCVCTYICTHTHTSIYMCVCTFVYIFMCACTHVYIEMWNICVRKYACACTYVYIGVCLRVYMSVWMCVYTCVYICMHVCTCMRTHTYTHAYMRAEWMEGKWTSAGT